MLLQGYMYLFRLGTGGLSLEGCLSMPAQAAARTGVRRGGHHSMYTS